jgi:hypothetical protein
MVGARAAFAAVLALRLVSLAPAFAAEGTSTASGAKSPLGKGVTWGGRKVLSGGPSRIIVNGVVVFESRPDKPTKPADVARPGSPSPTVSASPPPAALSFRSVPEDNPGRDAVDDNSPPPAALTRPAAPSMAIPPLPPRHEEHDDGLGHGSSPPSSVTMSPPMYDDHGGDTRGSGSPGGDDKSGSPTDKDDKSGSPSGSDDNSGSPSGKDDKGGDDSSGSGKDKDKDKEKGKGKGGGKN